MQRTAARTGDRRGPFVGSLIAVVFGLVFVVANSGELPATWSLAVRLTGAVIAVVLLAGSVWRFRHPASRASPDVAMAFGRRYWLIVAAEVVVLLAGLIVINGVLGAGEFGVAWVAVVVGVHFLALATIWWPRGFAVLGAVLALLGITGFIIDALGASPAAIATVAGVASGAALFVMVAAALARS